MSILTDTLPDSVDVCGEMYAVKTDFLTGVRFDELVTEAEYYLEVDRFDTEKGEFVLIDKEKKMQEKMNKVKPRNEKIAGMWNSFINRFKRKNNKDE